MEAIKQNRVKREGNKIVLTLPESFTAEEVDVLIWPSASSTSNTSNNLSESLLSWPQMTDEELMRVNEKRIR